ncbi:MAG: biotin/lipoyl-binding protein, partial [Bacteroidetes bacterium]
MKPESKNNRLRVYIPLAIVIIVVMTGAWYWYKDYSRYITTDDAHVDADIVSVSSKIIGRISANYAKEGDIIKQGTLLAELDSSDFLAQRNQSVALRTQAQAYLTQSEVKYS